MKIVTQKVIKNCPYTAIITYPPTEPHKNTFFKIMYVESGSAVLTLFSKKGKRKKVQTIKMGDMLIISPEDASLYTDVTEGSNGYRHRDIYLSVERMKECCAFLAEGLYEEIINEPFGLCYHITSNQQIALSEILVGLSNKKESAALDAQHKSSIIFCLDLYIQYKERFSAYPLWLHELLRKLEELDFLLLPVEQIAKSTNYSHEYVSRKFKYYIGKPLKQYVNQARLAQAALLLATSDFSVEEISYKSGFPSCNNFINAFKKEYGSSPGKYRKNMDGKVFKDTYVDWTAEALQEEAKPSLE